MLVEKFIIIGILDQKEVLVDLVKNGGYNNIIESVNMVKELKNDMIIDFYSPFNTKSEALKRLSEIYKNKDDVLYWSILPVIVEVSIEEARYLKLSKLVKKLK